MADPLMEALGARIRARRLEQGLTQTVLADAAGVSPRFLISLEKGEGNATLRCLIAVCTVLRLPLDQLTRGLGPGRPDKVALVGLRGAGKSTVGARLAARRGCPFVELDRLVEDEAGMPLAAVFDLRGEVGYRALEQRVLLRVLARRGPLVLATGGGLVTHPGNWSLLRERARTVWLRASPEAHLRRVEAQGDLRPMAGRPAALDELKGILRARAALYAQADIAVDTEELGVDGVVESVGALVDVAPRPAGGLACG